VTAFFAWPSLPQPNKQRYHNRSAKERHIEPVSAALCVKCDALNQYLSEPRNSMAPLRGNAPNRIRNVLVEQEGHAPASAIWRAIR
jgi:hypothetical protein